MEKNIYYDPDIPKEDLPGVLVHEGTHSVQDKNGELETYDFQDEREAYDNQYSVDKNFKDDAKAIPDQLIIDQYGESFETEGPAYAKVFDNENTDDCNL